MKTKSEPMRHSKNRSKGIVRARPTYVKKDENAQTNDLMSQLEKLEREKNK